MKQLIRRARKLRGLTQKELAIKTGISQTTVSALELGKIKAPTISMLIKLSKALNLPISYFVGEDKLSEIPTCKLCKELEVRTGVQKITVHDAATLKIFGDGESKRTEPLLSGPVLVFVVWD